MARGDTRIAVSMPTSSKRGVGGINKNRLEVGEAKSATAGSREHDDRIGAGVGGADTLWVTRSCMSLNVKHDDETGVGSESGVMGSVRSVLKGQYSVGGTMIRSGGGFFGRRVAEPPEQGGRSSRESPGGDARGSMGWRRGEGIEGGGGGKEHTEGSGHAPGSCLSGVHGMENAIQASVRDKRERWTSRRLPLYSNRERPFPEPTQNPIKISMEASKGDISFYVVFPCYNFPLTAASTLCAKYSMLLLFSPAIEMRPSIVM